MKKCVKRIRSIKTLIRNHQGVAAIEFALVVVPFLLLITSILELGLIYMVHNALDQSTTDAARRVRVGQIASISDVQTFKAAMCNKDFGIIISSNCENKLHISVKVFDQFSNIVEEDVRDASGANIDSSKLEFDIGEGGDIIVIRTFYRWTILNPFLAIISNTSSDMLMLESSRAFRNEPDA